MRLRPSRRDMLWFALGGGLAAVATWLLWPLLGVAPERIRTTLLEHPELLADYPEVLESVESAGRLRAEASQAAARAALLRGKWARFLGAATSPGLGDPGAPSVLVEFTDYACVPCKSSAGVVRQAVADRPGLRVAIVLLPTTGAMSELAARVALVANSESPQRFRELHGRLMDERRTLTQQVIEEHAAAVGLDVESMLQRIADPEHRRYFEQARALAADLEVAGVPAFVMDGALLLGGASAASLRSLLEQDSLAFD